MSSSAVLRVVIITLVSVMLISVFGDKLASQQETVRYPQIVLVSTGRSSCTGFIVGSNLVATAGHCVHLTAPIQEIRYIDGYVAPYKVLGYHYRPPLSDEDWALLRADTHGFDAYELDPNGAQAGQFIVHIGHPEGVPEQYAVGGTILHNGLTFLGLLSPAIEGESGSPIINTAGRVVGILTQTMRPLPYSIATTVGPLKQLVDVVRYK